MQKIIVTFALFLSGYITSLAQETHSITVHFSGMKSDEGSLFVALYDSEANFLNKRFKGDIVAITDKKATVIFKNIPAGIYAVSSFHDKNDNKKMDTNFFGIPKEPIGISNDATGFMGPPKFKDAKFNLTEDVTLDVNVN